MTLAYGFAIPSLHSLQIPPETNKKGTFVYQKFLFCLSKPQAWYIIAVRRISSRVSVYSCGLMIYTALP